MLSKLICLLNEKNIMYDFSNIDRVESEKAKDILCYLLAISIGSNYYNITLGRYCIKKISEQCHIWLLRNFESAVYSVFDMNDDYDYAVLFTLLEYSLPEILDEYVKKGMSSSNEFIREMSLEYACNPYNEIEYLNTNQYKELRKEYSFWESKFKSL